MDEIKYIEDTDYKIDTGNYLHAFLYEDQHMITMLKSGIKAPKLLDKPFKGEFNGSYYVSLMKYEDCEYDVYKKLIKRPMFIISSNIKTIYAENFVSGKLYWRPIIESPLPFRCSPYDNEYQKFLKVKPEEIIGLNYNLFDDSTISNKEKIRRLNILRSMILDLKNNNIDLDIVDYSNLKRINKDKVLSLNIKNNY